ncbi:acetyl-CoA C-acetyltransferase [Citricoccus nitrophenolicus]
MMKAYIVEAVRTPVGRRKGSLSAIHPNDLGATVLKAVLDRTGVPAEKVDDVIFGVVGQMGAQSANVARNAWLTAGLPETVPGVTLDRQCGSSQQAVHFAAQAVMSGTQDIVIAGGVEVMSLVPIASPAIVGQKQGMGFPYGGQGWDERFGTQEISQFRGAEIIAEKWGISRRDMEEFAFESHQRALAAIDQGVFRNEIVPVGDFSQDEGPRADSTLEKMAELQPLRPDGRITAAVASQISDGASAIMVVSEQAVNEFGLKPLAAVHTMSVVGSDPVAMLTGPIPATQAVLERSGLTLEDIDVFEVNEAFASVVLAWLQETGAPREKVNVNGGAIALGHPLGATGGRLMTSMIHHLRRTGGRYGLQTMCEGGGMANATVIEVL